MKGLVFLSAFLLTTGVFSFGQDGPAPSCPTIAIVGPAGPVEPGKPVRYKAEIDTKGREFELKYFWDVTAGKIIGGKGTAGIEVSQPENESQIVALEVKGLPGRCPDAATLSVTIDPKPEPAKPAQSEPSKSASDKPERICPTISVTGPGGIIDPGETVRFTADVSGRRSVAELRFEWTVKAATITKGQGTAALDVVYSDYPRVEAWVKVAGLPADCPSAASGIYEFVIDPGPVKLGEISAPDYDIDKTLLAKIENDTREQPNAQLYVILQFKEGTKESSMQRTRARIVKQLRKTGIDERRMTFAMADNGNTESTFWLIPPGSMNPAIDN